MIRIKDTYSHIFGSPEFTKGISVGSMSKCFSLAGLRLGWVATKDKALTALMHERRDYDTISCGVLDDMIASLALQNKEKIFDRNRSILLKNREILDKWVEEILKYKKYKRIDRKKEIKNCGYDAKDSAKRLEKIYCSK